MVLHKTLKANFESKLDGCLELNLKLASVLKTVSGMMFGGGSTATRCIKQRKEGQRGA